MRKIFFYVFIMSLSSLACSRNSKDKIKLQSKVDAEILSFDSPKNTNYCEVIVKEMIDCDIHYAFYNNSGVEHSQGVVKSSSHPEKIIIRKGDWYQGAIKLILYTTDDNCINEEAEVLVKF